MPTLREIVDMVVKRISALTREATSSDLTDGEFLAVDKTDGYTRKMTVANFATWVLGRIKSLPTSITTFRSGDVIAVDGPGGTAKMTKDNLLKETAQNALAGSIAPPFDPTRDSEHAYPAGYSVTYTDGKVYTFTTSHYGPWTDSDVEQKTFDSFVKNAIFDFSAGTDISASAEVTTGKYMNQYGSYNNNASSKVVLFDVAGVAAIKFSGVFFAGVYQIIYLDENRVGIGYENVYPREEYITIERVAGNAKYIAYNVPLASSFEAISGNVSFEGVNSAVQNLDKKTDERTLCSDFNFTSDITASASVTNGKYMKSNGSLANASGFMVVEFAVSGFDAVEFRGYFISGAYGMIQLDSSNHVLVTRDYGVLSSVVYWDIKLHPLATRLVFNCRIAFNFTCRSGFAIKTPVTEKIAELENKTDTNAGKIDGLENSVFNKHHEIGDVPSVAYKGNLTDYTWGSASTTYSEVQAKFDELLTPNYAYKEAIGTASDGSTLYIYKFTPKKVSAPIGFTKGLPGIFIMCAQHGFEKGSTFGTWHFLKDVVSNPDKNEFLRYVRNNVNLYVVPVANPWGFDNNEYINANSVNLNRNWWVPNWQKNNSEVDPSQNTGDAPFDQPETAAMRDFILAHLEDIDYVVDYHTNGRYNVSGLHNVNWISIADYDYFGDDFSDKVKAIAVNHCQKANGIIREIAGDALLGITGVEGEETMCCNITQGAGFPTTGYGPSYCITQGIMGSTLEGCNGFPNGDVFCDEEKQAMSAIIACWIQQTLFNFAKT